MIKNDRFFVPPQSTDENFKVLFSRLASVGAGRLVDKRGFADGPWTPETLANAISSIEGNEDGIELRAVQHWFQDNYSGISDTNIRWLARIFGCQDPEATSLWQAELRASKRRLTKERRQLQSKGVSSPQPGASEPSKALALPQQLPQEESSSCFNIARNTQVLFSGEGVFTLPLLVFTGACALALIAFSLNLHSVIYTPDDGQPRQVGFLWAPNWTVVFFVLLPLFLTYLSEVLTRWLVEWRPKLSSLAPDNAPIQPWDVGLIRSSYAFWGTLFVTVFVASGVNWVTTHLLPLLEGDLGVWPLDWGRVAIVQPERVSVPAAIAFSALVFLYNGFTAYLFFAGLLFLYLMKSDYALILKSIYTTGIGQPIDELEQLGVRLMDGIFRCTALGMTITLMMKLQSGFLQSGSSNILEWMLRDLKRLVHWQGGANSSAVFEAAAPGHIYSFFCVLAIMGTFVNAQLSIRSALVRHRNDRARLQPSPWLRMNICMFMLTLSYITIGLLPGFSLIVLLSLAVTLYAVIGSEKPMPDVIS